MYGPAKEMKWNQTRIWKWKEMKAKAASHSSFAKKDPLHLLFNLFNNFIISLQLFGGGLLLITSPALFIIYHSLLAQQQ